MTPNNSSKLWVVLAVLAFFVGGFAIYMKWNGISAQRDELQETQAKVDNAAGVEAERTESEARIAALRLELSHLERGVPDYAYVPTMLRELERYGKANGIEVTGVRPVAAPPPPPNASTDEKVAPKSYDELTIEVHGRGTFGDALRFTQALNRFPKIVEARTITMTPPSGTPVLGTQPVLDLLFQLKVFVFAQDNAPDLGSQDSSVPTSVMKEAPNANG